MEIEIPDEIIKLDCEFIKLLSEAKYERRGKNLYCLNYAEPGMLGCSMGKLMPMELAMQVLRQYKKETDYFKNRNESRKRKLIKTKDRENNKARIRREKNNTKIKLNF